MPITQQVFANSTIKRINSSIGWNGEGSVTQLELVDDPLLNQTFIPPLPGTPVFPTYSTWTMGGIFRDHIKDLSGQGQVYHVNISSPVELAQDVQIIIDGYTGAAPVSNLFNVYGYLESFGFGNSGANEAGIPYNNVIAALSAMCLNPGIYGGLIQFVGYNYLLDLSLMPASIPNYRIQGPVINLVDFIAQVCSDNGLDFFFRMNQVNNVNYIQVVTISRANPPTLGSIAAFVAATPGAVQKSVGAELRNETTAKFLIGDNILNVIEYRAPFPSGYRDLGQVQIPQQNSITYDATYPADFTFNYKFSPLLQAQVNAKAFPLCFPHKERISQITASMSTIWPYWGTDVYGIAYQPGVAQEEKLYIDYLRDCFNYYDTYIFNHELGNRQATTNWLHGSIVLNKGTTVYALGKSALLALIMYSDTHFFPSPIPSYPYMISIGELRAALVSQEAWENYVGARSGMVDAVRKQYAGFADKSEKDFWTNREIYMTTQLDKDGIPMSRADVLGISPALDFNDFDTLVKILNGQVPKPGALKANTDILMKRAQDRYSPNRLKLEKIHQAINQLASECYGKKFMISPNNVFVKLNDNLRPLYSDDPSSEGYFSGPSILSLNPLEQLFFQTQDGKLETFVEFDSVNFIDITKLNTEDFIIKDKITGKTYTNRQDIYQFWTTLGFTGNARLYLRCKVEPDLVFGTYNLNLKSQGDTQNLLTYSDPRIVITLPYPVYFRPNSAARAWRNNLDNTDAWYYLNSGAEMYDLLNLRIGSNSNDASRQNIQNNVLNTLGSKGYNEEIAGLCLVPKGCAYGLKSNTQFYGPWFAQGIAGKVEYEQDSNLNPWTFNGYTNMNLAGQAKVAGAATTMQFSEMGSVQIPDIPALNLGDVLIPGGPVVTDIQIEVGDAGVSTTYSMRSFSPFNGQNKQVFEMLRKASQRTLINERNPTVVKNVFENKLLQQPKDTRKLDIKMGTPHEMMMGSLIYTGSGGWNSTSVTETIIEARPELGGINYTDIGGVSMDALFRPFCLSPSGEGNLPKFMQMQPSSVLAAQNPYPNPIYSGNSQLILTSGHDIDYIVRGSGLPSDLYIPRGGYDSGNNYRGMGLRLPAVGVGYGLTIDGSYFPGNASGYAPDYASNPASWAAGPIDFRWDSGNGVWTCGGGATLLRGTANELILPDSGGSIKLVKTGANINATNWLKQPMCSGQHLMLEQEGSNYYVVNSEYVSVRVVSNITCNASGTFVTYKYLYIPAAYSNDVTVTL